MKNLPRFLRERYKGYEILDFKEWLLDERVEIYLVPRVSKPKCCHRCKSTLGANNSKHKLILEDKPVFHLKVFVHVWRIKGFCSTCNKHRSEVIDFVCAESPHLTAEYGWWLGRLCEISTVSGAAKIMNHDNYTLWRHDFERMKKMLQYYKIPPLKYISVDEVYARKKNKFDGENRNNKFFTVISDLATHKVVYVTEGRSKEALDDFYKLLGREACKEITVVAMDQFDGYSASTKEYCHNATIVWDKFHILKNFEESVNEVRKALHERAYKNTDIKRLSRGQFRFTFLKKASKRTLEENEHINSIIAANEEFSQLELIKEHMLAFFYQPSENQAKELWNTLGSWIFRMGSEFNSLKKWYSNLDENWNTLSNYFRFKVTTSLSEGINNVIKMLKRMAFGYRNMEYFKLKIMQKCGYLNSNFIPSYNYL